MKNIIVFVFALILTGGASAQLKTTPVCPEQTLAGPVIVPNAAGGATMLTVREMAALVPQPESHETSQ